jgi:hypothetical protein
MKENREKAHDLFHAFTQAPGMKQPPSLWLTCTFCALTIATETVLRGSYCECCSCVR